MNLPLKIPGSVLAIVTLLASMPVAATYEPFAARYMTFPVGLITYSGLVTDVTGDGEPDLVLASGNDWMKQPVVVYPMTDSVPGSRYPDWISDTTVFGTGSATGDFTGDGLPDIAVASSRGATNRDLAGGGIHIFASDPRAEGPVLLAKTSTAITGFEATDLETADIDGDGDLDLVVSTWNDGALAGRVYLNHDGSFTARAWHPVEGRGAVRVEVFDIDGDFQLELVFLGLDLAIYDVLITEDGLRTDLKWKKSMPAYPVGAHPIAFGLVPFSAGESVRIAATDRRTLSIYTPDGEEVSTREFGHFVSALQVAHIDSDGMPDMLANFFTHEKDGHGCFPRGNACFGGDVVVLDGTSDGAFGKPRTLQSDLKQLLLARYGVPYSVSQDIVVASITEKDECIESRTARIQAPRGARIVTLPFDHVTGVNEVHVDGVRLPASQFGHVGSANWLYLAPALDREAAIEVTYEVDTAADIVLTSVLSHIGSVILSNNNSCQRGDNHAD